MGLITQLGERSLDGVRRGAFGLLPDEVVRQLTRALFSRSWRRFESACQRPRASQARRLQAILSRIRDCEQGRTLGLGRISSIDAFQKQVPIHSYADLEERITRMAAGDNGVLTGDPVIRFAQTSGTTGPAKLIPITTAFVAEYQLTARMAARQVALAFPRLIRGNVLSIQSPDRGQHTCAGIPIGSITGAVGAADGGATGRLRLLQAMQAVPAEVYGIDDVRTRTYLILRFALARRISLISAINPSTILLLARKLTEHAEDLARDCERGGLAADLELSARQRRALASCLSASKSTAGRIRRSHARHGRVLPLEVWPELQGLLCWKAGPAPFYLNQFPEWFGPVPVMGMGYAATEGRFSVVLDAAGDAGVASLAGHFLEFIPEDRPRSPENALTAEQLEQGRRYYVLVTASNGLLRYDMNDLIEVSGFHRRAPLIRFCHKGDNVLSITGEKVADSHVVTAVSRALRDCGLSVLGFCAAIDASGETPRYELAIELAQPQRTGRLTALLHGFERELCAANVEYAAKRRSQRLSGPVLSLLSAGAFERWRLERLAEGAFEAHVKLPHVTRDRGLFDRLVIERRIEGQGES